MTEYVFDTKHDRYPVAVHVILTDGGWIVGSADGDGRVLLMRRAGSGYADGLLGLPAGHVDLGEIPTHCAIREVDEELGIKLDPDELNPAGVMFRRSLEPRVDIFFTTRTWRGTPTIREPNKCTQLVWANPDDLPHDTLDFVGQAVTDARQSRHFHEYGWASPGRATTEGDLYVR
jgi:8-oxo-dGTP diphosphatase